MEISGTVIGNVEQREGCRIVLQAPYRHGLKGLAGFGHVQVCGLPTMWECGRPSPSCQAVAGA
jgi:hypothetical protein